MSTTGDSEVSTEISMEAFKLIVEQAGLGMNQQELEELKPLYDLYLASINQLHSIDFQAVEMAVAFHPDWPA
jgi:hypothetical protein